jgi:hypothetical protein
MWSELELLLEKLFVRSRTGRRALADRGITTVASANSLGRAEQDAVGVNRRWPVQLIKRKCLWHLFVVKGEDCRLMFREPTVPGNEVIAG